MSPGLEFEGKNVEQALQKACKELNISKEKLKHDVISYGSTGIFGLVGSKKAKIRAIMPKQATENISPSKPLAESQVKSQVKTRAESQQAIETTQADLDAGKAYDEAVDLGRNVLQRIVNFITTDASVSIEKNSSKVFFNITGGVPALLIGKHGQTLEAIQHLTEKATNNNIEQRIRIQVDVEGYLQARHASLKKLVKQLSEKVKNTGKPVNVGQKNAHDRRIVHLALKNDANVTVKSIGDGFIKKMIIFPKKGSERNRKTESTQ
jgi:spoIIIJ-associated protein